MSDLENLEVPEFERAPTPTYPLSDEEMVRHQYLHYSDDEEEEERPNRRGSRHVRGNSRRRSSGRRRYISTSSDEDTSSTSQRSRSLSPSRSRERSAVRAQQTGDSIEQIRINPNENNPNLPQEDGDVQEEQNAPVFGQDVQGMQQQPPPQGVQPPPQGIQPPPQGVQPPSMQQLPHMLAPVERSEIELLIMQFGNDPTTRPMLESLFRSILMLYVRQTHPAMRSADERACLRIAHDCARLGLFDRHLHHLAKIANEVPGNNVVYSINPVGPGAVLCAELLSLVRDATGSPEQRESNPFRARLPSPEEFSGAKSSDRIAILKDINRWCESIVTIARLSGLDDRQTVLFAAQHLKGPAQSWWNTWANVGTCATITSLREGLTTRFVGHNPFELLCEELESLHLNKFQKFETFRANFAQVVAAMKAYAPSEDRIWPDTVLIDKLLVALSGTLYWEGVVLDPHTKKRPESFEAALELCDSQHTLLLQRKQAHGERAKPHQTDPKPDKPSKPGKQDSGKHRKRTHGGANEHGRPNDKRQDTGKEKKSGSLCERFMKRFDLPKETVEHRMKLVDGKYPCMKCGALGHDFHDCRKDVKKNI